jgi:hypothetical protein
MFQIFLFFRGVVKFIPLGTSATIWGILSQSQMIDEYGVFWQNENWQGTWPSATLSTKNLTTFFFGIELGTLRWEAWDMSRAPIFAYRMYQIRISCDLTEMNHGFPQSLDITLKWVMVELFRITTYSPLGGI